VKVHAVDGHVCTRFEDSGPGIQEPNRIFDPFYTTKNVGKGTGLGLSICYGIVKEHGGDISAANLPGGGASVEVKLPASRDAVVSDQPALVPRRELALAGKLLLVEDEEAVLEFERDVLAGAGAEVATLMNGEQAKIRLQNDKFDALIINGKMPGGWTAPEVHKWLQENCPELEKHVLYTFSSVPEPETRAFLQESGVPCLVKPFEVADLISHARRLMQKSMAANA
jgi:CheY-like chemotaxis protein